MIARFCGAIAARSSIAGACKIAGFSLESLRTWRRAGSEDIEAGLDTIFSELVREVDEAYAADEQSLALAISEYADRDWRAAKYLLERRHSKEWCSNSSPTLLDDQVESTVSDATEEDALAMFLKIQRGGA